MSFPSNFKPSKYDSSENNSITRGQKRLAKGFERLTQGPNVDQRVGINFKKGSFIRIDTGEIFNFQFNPESMTDSRSANYATRNPVQAEQVQYQHINYGERVVKFTLFLNGMENKFGRSTSAVVSQPFDSKFGALSRPLNNAFQGAVAFGARRVPFAEGIGSANAVIDKYFGKDIGPQPKEAPVRNVLEDMRQLDEYLKGFGNRPPPKFEFNWPGYDRSDWILTDLEFETTMWSKAQEPLHVTAKLTIKEVERRKTAQQSNAIGAGASISRSGVPD